MTQCPPKYATAGGSQLFENIFILSRITQQHISVWWPGRRLFEKRKNRQKEIVKRVTCYYCYNWNVERMVHQNWIMNSKLPSAQLWKLST